jgi:flavorubredoxin
VSAVKISEGLYWVGVIDWNIRNFHGHTYTTKRGTTYNAYLVIDEKIALVDTVYGPFYETMIERIEELIDPRKIDYLIVNHVETDHSGAVPIIKEIAKNAKVICSAKGKEGLLKHYYGNWDYQIVKTGEKLELGRKTLQFIEAPMLHWPDSMFSYLIEDQILIPNDAFGQHLATSERFDDEVDQAVLMDEAAKYYGNILWPLSNLVIKKIEEVQKLGIPIKVIAPSHGIIWRKDPGKIIDAYLHWARNETSPQVVVVYETMWGATEKMARKMVEGIIDAGVSVKLFDVNNADRTEIIKDMLEARGFLIGSSTHDSDMLTTIASFLEFLRGLKPKNRVGAAFGSFGWSGGAVNSIEKILKEAGVQIIQPSVSVKYVPDDDEIKRCYELGRDFAKKVKGV